MLLRFTSLILLLLLPLSAAAELSQDELRSLLKPRILGLKTLTKNFQLITAVRQQNAQGMSLEDIHAIDAQWQAGTSPLIQELQHNAAGEILKKIIQTQGDSYNEAFLTDAQGANVAAYPATSDYWQGDEHKFTAAFTGGRGEVIVGDMEYDESTHTNAVQISMPIVYANKAIGVLIVGVKLTQLEAEQLSSR